MTSKEMHLDEIRSCMERKDNIRHILVGGNSDVGKSTMLKCLVKKAGIKIESELQPFDSQKEENGRPVGPMDSYCSLVYDVPERILAANGMESYSRHLINIIPSAGRYDLRNPLDLKLTDGALFVVDGAASINASMEQLLAKAILELNKPVIFLNKLDRLFLERQMTNEEIYQKFSRIVELLNCVISPYCSEDGPIGNVQIDPVVGDVAFGCATGEWGFTLVTMAAVYSKKFKIEERKLAKRLWGDQFFDAKERKWLKESTTGAVRGFDQFCLEPIAMAVCLTMEGGKEEELIKFCNKFDFDPPAEISGKPLLHHVLRKAFPLDEALLGMITTRLPSPVTSQRYRMEMMYEGPHDDAAAQGIKNCDPDAPLMMSIAKMIPSIDKGRFYAFGRVLSGKVATGQKVLIMGPNYEPGKHCKAGGEKEDLYMKTIKRTLLVFGGRRAEPVEDVPCGNLCSLVGIDDYIVKSATVTTYEEAYPLKGLKFNNNVPPVVRVAVEPKEAQHLPTLVEGMRRLAKAEPLVLTMTEESGEHVVAGAGELHLERCVKDLEEFYAGIPLKKGDVVVSYRESVTEISDRTCLAKSPNKHNRLFMSAAPIGEGLSKDVVDGKVNSNDDFVTRASYLTDKYAWEIGEAKKIWCFGPEGVGPNLLVDVSKGVQYLNEIKDSVVAGFQWATKEGVLCDENMRGIRFNIHDVTLHADAIHRGGGQIIPAARRCLYACVLTAKPCVLEPVYSVSIKCAQDAASGIYSCLNKRRGKILEDGTEGVAGDYKAYLPVMESFGFTDDLRQNTGGKALLQFSFDHWAIMMDDDQTLSDPLEPSGRAGLIVTKIRQRKGLTEHVDPLDKFFDKL